MEKLPENYRADIDGLRAISVLAVVAYHFGMDPFTGGFVGVDVFFVISGYLITSQLWRDIQNDRFSLLRFYDRRFRRILPALIAVLLLSLAAGWFLLMPGDYEELGKQGAYAAFGLSNFYFLWNTGYFDQSSEMLPLLHTWSLAVEEQFYVVWPVGLATLAYLTSGSRRLIVALVILIIAVSLSASIWTVATSPTTAFYMPHTRAWELALGALLVFLPHMKSRILSEGANATGLGLIAFSVFTLTNEMPFPGINAIAPCVGSALIIWPKARTFTSEGLSLEPLRQIGLASYSWYLWHWPALVFFRHYANGAPPNTQETVVLGAVTLGTAFASLHFIERPFRKLLGRRNAIVPGLSAAAVAAVFGAAVFTSHGYVQRLPEPFQKMSSLKVMWQWQCPSSQAMPPLDNACLFGADWKTAKYKMLLWGDSFAAHFAPILQAALTGRDDVSVVLFQGCAPAYGGSVNRIDKNEERSREKCAQYYRDAMEFLSSNQVSAVFVAGSWVGKLRQLYTNEYHNIDKAAGAKLLYQAFSELASRSRAPGRRIVLVASFPIWGVQPAACAMASFTSLLRRQCSEDVRHIPTRNYHITNAPTEDVIKRVANDLPEIVVPYLPGRKLCTGRYCQDTINDEFIYRDGGHLRRNLSEETRRLIAQITGLPDVLKTVAP